MTHTMCELMWIQNLLQKLGFFLEKAMTMYCDNYDAIHIANNPMFKWIFISSKKVITPYISLTII